MKTIFLTFSLFILAISSTSLTAQDWEVNQALMKFTYEDTPGPPPAGPLISRWEMGIGNNFTNPDYFTLGSYKFVLDYILKQNALVIRNDNLFAGIGIDDPLARLHIYNDNTAGGAVPALLLGLTGGASSAYLLINKPDSDNNSDIARFRDNGNSVVVINETDEAYQLQVYGDIHASNVYTISDANYKTDISTLSSGLETINKLKPRSYKFKAPQNQLRQNLPEGHHYGVLAQELRSVLPNLVKESATYDEAGNPTGNVLAVNYLELIPILIAANQELSAQLQEVTKSQVITQKAIETLQQQLEKATWSH
jgi:hypothetical protein